MKKVAIVTLYDDINIGNKLQNYAVQCFFEGLGYRCETIRHWEMTHSKLTFQELKLNIIRLVGYPKASSKKLRLGEKRKKRFKKFSDEYLHLGPEVKIENVPDNLSSMYDFFVTGSDQVWHNWTNSKAEINYFFLQFAKEFQRLTIAPSFGKNHIEQDYIQDYMKGLNEIPVITCREQQGAELISKLVGREAEVILDPTMLVDEKTWNKIEKKPKKELPDKYILVYILGERGEDLRNYLEQLERKEKISIIDIYNTNIPDLYMTTPDEFIYYIHHAELVVTDSFHACVFSILFRTNFILFDRKTKSMGDMTSRLDTLLSTFNLSHRKSSNCVEDRIFYTDYSLVDAILCKERERVKEIYKKTFDLLETMRLTQEEGRACK